MSWLGLERDDGLEHQREVAGLERSDEVGLELQAFHGGRSHIGVVHGPPRLARRLGPVHRDVGVAQERRGGGVGATGGDADAGRDRYRLRLEHDRGRERLEHALGDRFRLVEWVRALLDEDRELVAGR